MNKYLLFTIFLLGNLLHIACSGLNDVMKIADSFAYLQMAHHLKDFDIAGLGNGWFGFAYSLPIALMSFVVSNDMMASFIVNILLFNLLAGTCYMLGKNYLSAKYNALFLILIFLSPILLSYNIHILSENLYIPLFLMLFIGVLNYKFVLDFSGSIFFGLMIALLYYTRSEAFIYLGSVGLIYLYFFFKNKLSFTEALGFFLMTIVSFLIFISPYIFYLHSFTGERGLTNKGSSNLRQAELRGISKMDDDGFEQAVAELTPDNHHLIAGFAGGLKYDKPAEGQSFKEYLLENPAKVGERIKENQIKLYSSNLPKLILGDAKTLYSLEGSHIFYKNTFFLILLIIPMFFLFFGMFRLYQEGEGFFLYSLASFFFIGSFFFTLFFVLDRYFVIFVPLFLFVIVYGIEKFDYSEKKVFEYSKYILMTLLLVGIYSLGMISYYNTFKDEDAKYEVKKQSGERLKQNDFRTNLRVMERFPVVTYYAGSWERWITPYTDKVENVVEYAHFNDIHYLVVDSVDFFKYRPGLQMLYNDNDKKYKGLSKVKTFEKNGETVILYRVE